MQISGKLPNAGQQLVIEKFRAVCESDARVVAAFVAGSYAQGTADEYSDLDLCVITTDEGYTDFFAERASLVRRLGEPVFMEVWNGSGFDSISFVFADGTDGEIVLGRESNFLHMHNGTFLTLLDKKGVLANVVFPRDQVDAAQQTEKLRQMIYWFWHDVSHHFITPLARGQLWGAYGALEDMRLTCINLTRLRANFRAEAEGFEKVENAIDVAELAPLQSTFCPMERGAMLHAARVMVDFYRELAPPLAAAHGINYPHELERLILERFAKL